MIRICRPASMMQCIMQSDGTTAPSIRVWLAATNKGSLSYVECTARIVEDSKCQSARFECCTADVQNLHSQFTYYAGTSQTLCTLFFDRIDFLLTKGELPWWNMNVQTKMRLRTKILFYPFCFKKKNIKIYKCSILSCSSFWCPWFFHARHL